MATSITLRAMRANVLERLLRDPRNHGLTPAEIRDLPALGRHPAAPRKRAA